MTDRSVITSTFTLERDYPAAPATVFAAWADPGAKRAWFAPTVDHYDLDFRVDGGETLDLHTDAGAAIALASRYHDIVENERIVYSSTLFENGVPATVSLTSVQLLPEGDGTRLVLVEQGTFLDGREEPTWRERGTADWLDALGTALKPA